MSLEMVKKVANTKATVLITGDSGTGKELIALAIHAHSDRKDKLFLPVTAALLPETLLESLLFGHMKGSFTGAFANQEGLFEKAQRRDDFSGRDRRNSPASTSETTQGVGS